MSSRYDPEYVIAIEGLSEHRPLEAIDPKIIAAASQMSVNKTAIRARTASKRAIMAQINLKSSYLDLPNRLWISKQATAGDTEAVITARKRPTMLARFVTSGRPAQGGNPPTPVTLSIHVGTSKERRRMFLIRLPAGSRGGEDGQDNPTNLGLAIRLKPGETITGKHSFRKLKGNLYLLYGPSVDQAFATVREDIAPDTSDFLETEFLRQLDRLS